MELTLHWKKLLPMIILEVVYLCVGAVVFKYLEGQPEMDRRTRLTELITHFLANQSCITNEELADFLEDLGADIPFAKRVLRNKTTYTQWDFTGSFSFVITVVSTIGYGDLAPKTEFGRVAVVAYALFGIPLTLIMLSGLGQHLTLLSRRVNKLKLCSKKPGINKYLNMVLIIILGVTFLFIGPSFVFHYVEHWGMLECLYYCFITLSTIGFGDYVPALYENRFSDEFSGNVYRIVAYVWILFGLAYLALVISYISSVLMRNADRVEKKAVAKLEVEIKNLQRELSKRKEHIFAAAETVAMAAGISLRRSPTQKKSPPGSKASQSIPKVVNGVQLLGIKKLDNVSVANISDSDSTRIEKLSINVCSNEGNNESNSGVRENFSNSLIKSEVSNSIIRNLQNSPAESLVAAGVVLDVTKSQREQTATEGTVTHVNDMNNDRSTFSEKL